MSDCQLQISDMIRKIIREELASLAPDDLPLHRQFARRREDLGKTQEQAAKELSAEGEPVSASAVAAWETGRMPINQALRYGKYLGLRIFAVVDHRE